jgi:glycosyltransferase involved in cell wall biosynthesis
MRLAIAGIRGLPNNYGGFETLAEYLVEYLAQDIDITVYCSSKDMDSKLTHYKGARLKYIPVTSHGSLGIVYDTIGLLKAVRNNDAVLFLGFGGGFLMPFLSKKSKKKITLNIGGLDWKRNKWSPFAQKVIKKAEALLINNSSKIVSDNVAIQKYIKDTYDKDSVFIAYGGDQALKQPIDEKSLADYPFLKNKYAFTVTRIQQDNNIDMILDSFVAQENIPLVIVGNWNNSEYGKLTKAKYLNKQSVILLDAIYDRTKLDILRSNCTIYIHGHSAGGTNPSLAEAMFLGLPVFAYSSGYNEHTTENKAVYFNDSVELTGILKAYETYNLKEMGNNLQEVAKRCYIWKDVAEQYRKVIADNYNSSN